MARSPHISILILIPLASGGCFPETITVSAPEVTYSAVAAGDSYACGLADEGEVYCWGIRDPRPKLVSASLRFASVSAQSGHICGLTSEGRAYCWGLNMYGQLGNGSTSERCTLYGAVVSCSRTPLEVSGGIVFSALAVGSGHTCALDAGGAAYCWGLNERGQLGTGEEPACDVGSVLGVPTCSAEPVAVAGGFTFASLSAGAAHTCGVTLDGDAYCWGAGGSGRLGSGTLENENVPVRVTGGNGYRGLSAGGTHTCGLSTDGALYCWGSNADLQLGSKAQDPQCGGPLHKCVTDPQVVLTDVTFAAVTASAAPLFGGLGPAIGGHTCGLTADGDVYCWGLNENGQLMNPAGFRSAIPVQVNLGVPLTQISAGLFNTCGVTEDGRILCWAFGTPWDSWRVLVN